MSVNIINPDRYQLDKGGWAVQASPLALSWIETFLREKKQPRILEWGSGVSTVLLGKLFPQAQIYSIEGDPEWFEQVSLWFAEEGVTNIIRVLKPQTNFYTSVNENNMDYLLSSREFGFPFDLILNDGGMREIIGDYVLTHAGEYLAPGGLYLRHDFEKYLSGDWRGFHLEPEVIYEQFVLDNPAYQLVLVNGNGKWGYKAEYGGIWRKA